MHLKETERLVDIEEEEKISNNHVVGCDGKASKMSDPLFQHFSRKQAKKNQTEVSKYQRKPQRSSSSTPFQIKSRWRPQETTYCSKKSANTKPETK